MSKFMSGLQLNCIFCSSEYKTLQSISPGHTHNACITARFHLTDIAGCSYLTQCEFLCLLFFWGEAGWVPVDLHVKFENFLVFFFSFCSQHF